MAVTSCKYDWPPPSADIDEVGMGTYTVRYKVTTDSLMGPKELYAGAQALGGGNDIPPDLFDAYSFNGTDSDSLSWFRRGRIFGDDKTKFLYYIEVTYTPAEPGEASGGTPINSVANPVNRAAVMWWDREVYTHTALVDKDGKAIVNKAQDYYPEDIEHEAARGVLVVEKNYSTLAQIISASQTYDGAVNSTTWNVAGTSVPPRVALCREVSSGPQQTEQNYQFYRAVFRFALRQSTWDEVKIECGQFHWAWNPSANDYVRDKNNVWEIDGHRRVYDAQKIVPLDVDGTRLADGEDFVKTSWRVRREVDFNTLGF